jgi:hypothetical protein
MDQRVRFSVMQLAACEPGEAAPALSHMPPLLRRHAGRLGRLACDVAYRALDGAAEVPVVFCSRYGEVARSVDLLTALAQGAPLSPTAFGLSVHNAAMGLFSMARKDTANCIAIAAGEESAALGAIEACGLLREGAERVLLVVADCALPEVYQQFADVDQADFAWACVVTPPGSRAISVTWDQAPAEGSQPRQGPAALDVLRFLQSRDDHMQHMQHTAGGRRWHWHRDA